MGPKEIIEIYKGFFKDEKTTWERISVDIERENSWMIYIIGVVLSGFFILLGFSLHGEIAKGFISFVLFVAIQLALLYPCKYLLKILLNLTSDTDPIKFLHYGLLPFWLGFIITIIPFLFLWIFAVLFSSIYTAIILQKGGVPILKIPSSLTYRLLIVPILYGIMTILFFIIVWSV